MVEPATIRPKLAVLTESMPRLLTGSITRVSVLIGWFALAAKAGPKRYVRRCCAGTEIRAVDRAREQRLLSGIQIAGRGINVQAGEDLKSVQPKYSERGSPYSTRSR